MADVVAVLLDQYFFISDAQHELSKRELKASGPKFVLIQRLFEALEAEYAEGWTLGYLLNTKILPSFNKGRDPQSLIGQYLKGYRCDGDSIIILELSTGEDVTILSSKTRHLPAKIESNDDLFGPARIKMDDDLFWALHTLDGMMAVPRQLAEKPLLIIEAETGVRKDRWGKEAGIVLGLKLEGMRAISFFFLAGGVSIREDGVCGHVWLAEKDFLAEDIRILHGCDEMVIEERDETIGLEENIKWLEENIKRLEEDIKW